MSPEPLVSCAQASPAKGHDGSGDKNDANSEPLNTFKECPRL